MSESEDVRQERRRIEWDYAKLYAKEGDYSKLIKLLRAHHQPGEDPDLGFIADLLEGHFKKSAGRPPDGKILAGLKELQAAQVVHKIIETKGLTVEEAVATAKDTLPMSESAIKKRYYGRLNKGLLGKPSKAKSPSKKRSIK